MINNEKNLTKFSRICEEYKNMMYFIAFDISKNPTDAEDIVEEALIKIIKNINVIDEKCIGETKCKNFIITITKHTAIDFLRKMKKESTLLNNIPNTQFSKSAEELYLSTERYQELITCISELDEKYREVLQLKCVYNLTSKQIGKILNISESNVNMRFMRAKEMLRNKLKELEK